MVRAHNALHAKMACPTNNQDNCTKTVIQHFSYSVSDESVRRCANVHKVFRFLQMQVFLWNQLKTCKQVTYRYSEQRGSACPRLSPCTPNVFTQNPKNSRPHCPHPLSNLCCTKSTDMEFFSTSRICIYHRTWAVQAKPPTSNYLELMSTPCALLKQSQCN
jgi:hypothetical protein